MSELRFPETGLEQIEGILDPNDPFERLVLDFKAQAESDTMPTPAEQKVFLRMFQNDNGDSASMLAKSHMGFIAAVAYPFRGDWATDSELVLSASKAFLAAAKIFDLDSDDYFSEYSIIAVRRLLTRTYPEAPFGAGDIYPEHPMDDLLHMLHGLRSRDDPEIQQALRMEEAQQKLSSVHLTPNERKIMSILHLYGTDAESGENVEFSSAVISGHAYNARKKLGLETREELALLAMEAGVLNIRAPQGVDQLTLRQRAVASQLDKPTPQVAAERGLSEEQVTRDIAALYRVTQARSRIELFLMSHTPGFQPTAEELAIHPVLQDFTPFQRPMIARIHLPTAMIAEQVESPEESVKTAITTAATKAGFTGRRARTNLALDLHEKGFRFNVREPLLPLAELLSAKELEVGRLLSLPSAEIAEAVDETPEAIDSLVHEMRKKTGAHSRTELTLQILMYDTGESRPKRWRELTREEQFFTGVGMEPVPMEQARAWLSHASERQAQYIDAIYFQANTLSLEAIARQLEVSRSTLIETAKRGLKSIGEALED